MMKVGMRPVALPWDNVTFEPFPDGSLRVRNSAPLSPYPGRLTERLRHWAQVAPDRVLLASRDGEGWRKVTCLEAFNSACAIGQALLDRGLSVTRPVLILSGNGIEHGLLSLGCLHVGIPVVPLSTAYSLISTDLPGYATLSLWCALASCLPMTAIAMQRRLVPASHRTPRW
jgi:feruloyl-CoA synthase